MQPGVGVVPDRSGGRLAGHVYEEIKERLLQGRYDPGERLQVEALKSDLGVSRQPVMDALRRLSGDGLVEIIPQVGWLRRSPDPAARARDYRVLNRQYHAVVHAMAHSRIMVETTRRMWDLSDSLINTVTARPLANALDGRHEEHELIREALERRDAAAARREMEAHILGTLR